MVRLALVDISQTPDAALFDVLLLGGVAPRITRASARNTPNPQISLLLHAHYEGTGRAIEVTGGVLAEVRFLVLRAGQRCEVLGVAVPLLAGTELVFPFGFFPEGGKQRLNAA